MVSGRENGQLFRMRVVSLATAFMEAGLKKKEAVEKICSMGVEWEGNRLFISKRSIYRWLKAFNTGRAGALMSKPRLNRTPSHTLSEAFLAFLKSKKEADMECSIPNIISEAEILGIVRRGELSRTTVWREARRLNLPLHGILRKKSTFKRRFEYAHRMQMVLCDGKQFRAGRLRVKRVVFNFLDDYTRKIIGMVVGKTENKKLFLRGLHQVLLKYGKMSCLYLDKGSAFVAKDVEAICMRLGIHLIFGATAYPEGHGKIERFNKTIGYDLLRTFSGDPEIATDISHLEMRIRHYNDEIYNKRTHGSLGGFSPNERWQKDTLFLMPIDDIASMERKFVVTKTRKVSEDNIVSIDGKNFEIPMGYSGKRIVIEQDFIQGSFRVLHEGKMVAITIVDLHSNAKSKRPKPKLKPDEPEGPKYNAARISFKKAFRPVVNSAGDCFSESTEEKK